MPVPLLDLPIQHAPLEDEFKAAFERVLKSGRYIMGGEVECLETGIAELSGCKHGIGVSSGTDAILLSLMSMGIGEGDEVICPSFTFFATAGCISRTGAKPVFADICPVTFNSTASDFEPLITEKTKAIIPVHLFGQTADMQPIRELAEKHGLKVIEDAAQALGARYNDQPVGTLGDCATFSFFPSKNLGGMGDSGMIVTNDDALAEHIRVMRVHGGKPKYYHPHIGGNFRMDPLQAALLSVKLPHYVEYCAHRQVNAGDYIEQLLLLDGVEQVGTSPVENFPDGTRIVLPRALPNRYHIWNQFTLRVLPDGKDDNARDRLKAYLLEKGIGCEIYYPLSLHQQECFKDVVPAGTSLPVCEALSQQVLSIPIFPELTNEQRAEVIAAIAQFLK